MNPAILISLEITKLILEIVLQMMRDTPPELRQQMMRENAQNYLTAIKFCQETLEKLSKEFKP